MGWITKAFCLPTLVLMAEILHQLIGSLSHYLQGFIHPRWCRISSINTITSCIWSFRSSRWEQLQRMVHKHRWIVIVPWLNGAIPDPLNKGPLVLRGGESNQSLYDFRFFKVWRPEASIQKISKDHVQFFLDPVFQFEFEFLDWIKPFPVPKPRLRDVTFWDFDLTRHWSLICDKQWIHRLSFAFRVTNALGMKTATWRHQLHWSGPAWEWTAWLEGVTCQKVKSAIIARLRLDTVIWLLGYAYAREVWIHWHGHHGTLWRLHRGAPRTQGGHQCMRWRLNAHACTRIPCAQCQ